MWKLEIEDSLIGRCFHGVSFYEYSIDFHLDGALIHIPYGLILELNGEGESRVLRSEPRPRDEGLSVLIHLIGRHIEKIVLNEFDLSLNVRDFGLIIIPRLNPPSLEITCQNNSSYWIV